MSFTYDYPHMAVTVDIVTLAGDAGARRLLLVRRSRPPFAGQWALPGGYVDIDERVLDAARREVREETGLEVGKLTFVGYFDAIKRDPRERTLSLAFLAVLGSEAPAVAGGDDAADARWFGLDRLPDLAFDHAAIIAAAIAQAEG